MSFKSKQFGELLKRLRTENLLQLSWLEKINGKIIEQRSINWEILFFHDGAAWLSTAVRLVLIPLLTLGLLFAVPKDQALIRTAVLLVAATPVGANAAIFAQVFDQDYKQAVKSICLSTICCIVTIPLIISLAQWLWQ